jgi:hypothetical protein
MRKNVEELLIQLEEKLNSFEHKNEKISEGTVGWHIEHSLLVIIKICESISSSNPEKYQWKFNLKWLIISVIGSLPRGKAKAPPTVIPESVLSATSLKESFSLAKTAIESLKKCYPNQYFFHPFFGKMNQKSTLEFFSIHTNHHLKIIKDILEK